MTSTKALLSPECASSVHEGAEMHVYVYSLLLLSASIGKKICIEIHDSHLRGLEQTKLLRINGCSCDAVTKYHMCLHIYT